MHAGDQLRAKGDKNADGTALTAEEVVVGTFRNLSGRLTAVDTAQNTLTLQDLATKKTVTIAVTADSQMKKLPQTLAYGLAARLKGLAPVSYTHLDVYKRQAFHHRKIDAKRSLQYGCMEMAPA